MSPTVSTIVAYLFIYLVYLLGKLVLCLRYGIYDRHIFLGFGEKPAFTFSLNVVTISVGLFIPLPYFARFYSYQADGSKERMKMAWEYADRPILHRLLINFGGAFSMMAMAIFFFLIIGFTETQTFIGKNQVDKYGIYPDSLARSYGFEKGDRITAINGQYYERFLDLKSQFLENENTYFTVKRGNQNLTIEVNQEVIEFLGPEINLFSINCPFKIHSVIEHTEAHRIGLIKGDQIVQINETPIICLEEFAEHLKLHSGDSITLTIKRDEQLFSKPAVVPNIGKLGFYSTENLAYTTSRKNPLEAIIYGLKEPFRLVWLNIKSAYYLIFGGRPEPQSLSGPVRISQYFGSFSILNFLKITGMILAGFVFYEFLPFPKTAMTRTIPLITEGLFNKPFNYKLYHRIDQIFWGLIIILFTWTIVKDISQLL